MGSEVQRNPYRDAYIAANAELDEVIEQFAQLRARKQRVEVALEALRQLVDGGGHVIPINQAIHPVQAEPLREAPVAAPIPAPQVEMRPGAAQAQAGTRPAPVQSAMDDNPDSLEKRIASALGRVAFA